jgi:hypothetical protein
MRFLSVVCVSCTLLFFGGAAAQDTTHIYLRTCAEKATNNDPSIVTRAVIDARYECGKAYPAKMELVDLHYGFRTTSKSLHGVATASRVIPPTSHDVFTTHKPCRFAYRHEDGTFEGIVAEWLIPKNGVCDGRPDGSYYRVYTWDNRICLRPHGGCVAVNDLSAEGQRRFREVLTIAYETAMN